MFVPMKLKILKVNFDPGLLFFTHFDALPPYRATKRRTSRIPRPFAITRDWDNIRPVSSRSIYFLLDPNATFSPQQILQLRGCISLLVAILHDHRRVKRK